MKIIAQVIPTTCSDCSKDFPFAETVTIRNTADTPPVDLDYCVPCAWQQLGADPMKDLKVVRNALAL